MVIKVKYIKRRFLRIWELKSNEQTEVWCYGASCCSDEVEEMGTFQDQEIIKHPDGG